MGDAAHGSLRPGAGRARSGSAELHRRFVVSNRCRVSPAKLAEHPHIRFPGLFNECEFYVNGREAGRREQNKLWWLNDYRFEWTCRSAASCVKAQTRWRCIATIHITWAACSVGRSFMRRQRGRKLLLRE